MKNNIFLSLMIFFSLSVSSSQTVIHLDYLFSIGERGDKQGQFQQPQGIDIDLMGNVYVADTGNHRLQKFDLEGNFQVYIGGIGSRGEQFDNPSDICTPDGLNVYVTDMNNNRIQILDRKLNAVSIFSNNTQQRAEFQFSFPKSITVSNQGDLFIVEIEENSILKFNSFYTPIARFGAIETGEGILNSPVKIEIIKNEFISVSDGQAARIALFDYFGNFIKYLGEEVLSNPGGLYYWQEKNLLLVSDLNQQKIYAFTLSGQNQLFRVIQKNEENKWASPVDLVIFQNKLFVLDQEKNEILVYRILNIPDLN